MADDKNNEQTNPDADGSLDFSLDQSLVLKTGDEKGSGNEKGSVHETYASDQFVDDGTSMDLDAGLAAAFGGGDADDGLSDDGDDNARQDDTERDSLTVSSVGSPSGGSVRSGQQDETRETAIRVREGSSIFADKYELIRQIGEGGLGAVWLAHQMKPVRRSVAVKVIRDDMDSKSILKRFAMERQALAMMDHPNIARVLDAGESESQPFFVMELVDGTPITKFCDEHRLTISERLKLFAQVCRAIQHAHPKGVIHRDIKPSNVLVARFDDQPVPKVIDFGVAKAAGPMLAEDAQQTAIGAIVGTPEYGNSRVYVA
jgi:serine/threonine protein kinase